jgi:hypothetical protein
MAHAILSASASHRWLECPPSARLERNYPDKQTEYAAEGTRAHALAEQTLTQFLAGGDGVVHSDDAEMQEAVQAYVDACLEKMAEARSASPDAKVLVEQHLDFSDWVPQGFGTSDMVMVSDKYIEVVDLKYGKGVPVSAEGNTQMRLYALGAYAQYGFLYSAKEVRMTIVQPRLDSISTDSLSEEALVAWGNQIRPIAGLAYAGKGKYKAGDHCRFCRARNTCRAYSEYMLAAVRADFAPGPELEDHEISEILLKAKKIKDWLTGVEGYALDEALQGKSWPDLKLVEGRSNRKIVDNNKAMARLQQEGYEALQILKPAQLKSITELEKLAGKKKFAEIMAGNIDKPPGKPALVSIEDKRPEINPEDVSFNDELL